MGCWHETCAITSVPIGEGEPVMLIRIDLTKYKPFEGIHHRAFGYRPHDFRAVIGIHPGEYNDYGNIEDSPVDSDVWIREEKELFVFIHRSVWNSILAFAKSDETFRASAEETLRYIKEEFEARAGIRRIMAAYKELATDLAADSSEPSPEVVARLEALNVPVNEEPIEHLWDLVTVAAFAMDTRRDILQGHKWSGAQAYDQESQYDHLAKLMQDHNYAFWHRHDED